MPSTTDSRSTTLLIKQETGNVSFCEGRMTREREGWKTISARKRMESKRNFWISEISEKQQAYSAQDSQQGDRQVPKQIGSTTNYSVKDPCSCPCGEFKLKKPDIVFDLINLTLILTCSNTSHVCGKQQHTLKEFNLGYFQTTVVKL